MKGARIYGERVCRLLLPVSCVLYVNDHEEQSAQNLEYQINIRIFTYVLPGIDVKNVNFI